jgi:DNA polymerase-3 subunit alpha
MAFEVERIELPDAPGEQKPRTVELSVQQHDLSQSNLQFLTQILKKYPGQDGAVLYVRQQDGRKFRAELPLTVDSHNRNFYQELHQLFGRKIWGAAS